jgi:hypothetical protein
MIIAVSLDEPEWPAMCACCLTPLPGEGGRWGPTPKPPGFFDQPVVQQAPYCGHCFVHVDESRWPPTVADGEPPYRGRELSARRSMRESCGGPGPAVTYLGAVADGHRYHFVNSVYAVAFLSANGRGARIEDDLSPSGG